MSVSAETWAMDAAEQLCLPDPCLRRQVLLALAVRHRGGPFDVPTTNLLEHLQIDVLALWSAITDLHRKDVIRARNIGGLMTVTLALDFEPDNEPRPAEVSALPASRKEAVE